MCLIAWSWQPASATPLLLLSNRDEFYDRPALPLHWWDSAFSGVLAGKDQQAGGTWLGVSRHGRLAALTNYRTALPAHANPPSRGELVAQFLQGSLNAESYLQALSKKAGEYNPFNLLVFDGEQLMGLESRSAEVIAMKPGIGGVSNANFHTPWPKLTKLLKGLQRAIENESLSAPDLLISLLRDPALSPDHELPDTGIPLDLERSLSAIFIATPPYGTRASSVVHIHRTHIDFTEQTYNYSGLTGSSRHQFEL
jgi:uncharacterized protein with NRDE domain